MTATQQNIPALRFPEFHKDWMGTSLREISESVNYGIGSAAIDYDGKNKYLRITDIDEENNIFSPNPLCSPSGVIDKKYVLGKGDIVFARTGASVGKTYLYRPRDGRLIFAGFLIRFSINSDKGNSEFIFFITLRSGYKNWVSIMSARSGQPGINAEEYKTYRFMIPEKEEQQKIAAFLSSVDTKIEQLNKKKALLKQYKKGMMQKLFSQEIRFKDEQGKEYPDWEKKQLSCIATKVSDSYNPVNSEEKFKCIELESLSSESGQVLKTLNASEQKSIKTKFVKGDVLFGKLRPYLKKYYRAQFNGVCTSEIWVLRPKSVPSKFLYYVVQSLPFNRMANVQSGSKMPRSDWKIVSQSVFTIPFSHQEQQKISNFLSVIDKKIELVAEQLQQAQTFKKGLLQQMFI